MEKDGLVLLNFFRDHPDHIARSDQPARPTGRALQPSLSSQPSTRLSSGSSDQSQCNRTDKRPSLSRVTYFCAPVAGASHILAQVDGSIGGVIHAEQQHLPIQFIYPANRAVQSMRDIHRGAVIRAACGPAAAKACGLSLRSTPGSCQKVWATMPMPMQEVARGSNGWSSSAVMLGITSVPSGLKQTAARQSILPAHPPPASPGKRRSVPAAPRRAARQVEQLPGDLALGDHCSLHVVLIPGKPGNSRM